MNKRQCDSCRHSTTVFVCFKNGTASNTMQDCGLDGSKSDLKQWRTDARSFRCERYESYPVGFDPR